MDLRQGGAVAPFPSMTFRSKQDAPTAIARPTELTTR